MRTTINLPDGLGEAAKARAAAEGRTFTSLVEEALRAILQRPTGDRARVDLPVFAPRGGRGQLVDIHDRDALWEALDADGPR